MSKQPPADNGGIPPADRTLTEKEFRRDYAANRDRSTLYRMRKRGDAPPMVQITGRRFGVTQSDAERWRAARKIP